MTWRAGRHAGRWQRNPGSVCACRSADHRRELGRDGRIQGGHNLPLPAGSVVHKGNVDQVKALIPPGLEKLIRKYELKLTIKAYEPIHPSLGYIAATNENRGKTKVFDVGKDYRKPGITGWAAGLPFPKPASALEVATNFVSSYTGDDADRYYDVYWISAKSGVEHNEYWHWASLRGIGRTDIDPKPNIDVLAKERLAGTAVTFAIEPYDKKGFGALFSRSIDPIDLQGHTYVPAMRRILRMSFGTRGDAWNATDYLYEDVGGYLGAVEWMNWKLVGQKTMLMPLHGGVKHAKDTKVNFEIDDWPHWNPKDQMGAAPCVRSRSHAKVRRLPVQQDAHPGRRRGLCHSVQGGVRQEGRAMEDHPQLPQGIGRPEHEADGPGREPGHRPAGRARHRGRGPQREVERGPGPELFTVASLRKRGH